MTAPHPDDARQSLHDLRARRAEIDRLHAEWERDLVDVITQARAAGIHGAEIAEIAEMSRAWLYRQFGDAMRG